MLCFILDRGDHMCLSKALHSPDISVLGCNLVHPQSDWDDTLGSAWQEHTSPRSSAVTGLGLSHQHAIGTTAEVT